MAAVQFLLSVAVAISFLCGHVKCEPKVLDTFSEIVTYLSAGAPVQVNVDAKHCTLNMPKELPTYSFSQKLDGVFLDPNERLMTLNFSSDVNGSRYELHGPAIRLFQMTLIRISPTDSSGNFFIKDFDPENGAEFVAGEMVCKLGTGLIPVAGTGFGEELTTFGQLQDSLLAGHDVFFNLEMVGREHKMFGQILDYRFDEKGALVFSRSFPATISEELARAFMTVINFPSGDVGLEYYVYKFGSRSPPEPRTVSGRIGDLFHYFEQY